ncbi:hypothetical protein HHL26_23770 [Sphingobium sp. TB-6]|nr:hypothetical protein [Sphingobium sp. TB-6]NML92021.1 hypothetical protein [Sphingobium sp. TB-6]
MSKSKHQRGRDSITGRIIPIAEANRRPRTTTIETFTTDKNGRPKN